MKSFLRTVIENKAPPYVGTRRGLLPAFSGIGKQDAEAQMRAFGTVGVLNAIVSRISEAVAEADWGLYRIGTEEEVPEHPAALMWAQPNPFMDQDEFVETSLQHFELVGEFTWNVARSSSRMMSMPLELWPLRPDYVTPIPSAARFLEGWSYAVPGAEPIPYKVDDIIQQKRPNPLDPYRGLSPVAAAMIDVYGERAASEYNAMFFRNSAEPGGIIEFPERLDQEAFDEFVERWNSQHQGVSNAHKVGMIEGGKWVERKYTLRDMEFVEQRKLNREFIRQAFGYPKSMLGDTEDVNKASAIAGEYVFVRWLIRPRLNRLQATLNTKLLPMFGKAAQGLEFRFTTPVPADKELELKELDSQATRAKTLVDAGYDPAEVAKWAGLPEMAFVGPATRPDGAPEDSDEPAPAMPRRGRPRTSDDPQARAIWQQALDYWEGHPRASYEVVSGFLNVSERTLRRYRDAFEGD